jgi:hypothetical protein
MNGTYHRAFAKMPLSCTSSGANREPRLAGIMPAILGI